jgi:hypothetical protein
MADGKDTSVERMKSASGAAVLDRVLAKPERDQLPVAHHAVLSRRQIGEPPIAWAV